MPPDCRSLHEAWKRGGMGRLRVVARQTTDPNQPGNALEVLDSDGITPANATTLVLAATFPKPTEPPGQNFRSIRDPLNSATPNYLSANSRVLSFPPGQLAEQRRTAREYYARVGTNPDGTGPSIQQRFPTLRSFINHYFRPFECRSGANEPERVTKYFNKGDLGLGREMHCVNRGCTGELICYVKNFAGIAQDGKPIFGPEGRSRAQQALLESRPFATVAMVERSRMAPDADTRVFFAVYEHIGRSPDPARARLALQAQLDNKGYNTSIPGNCLQCHGINSSYTADGGVHRVRNATFLPFDLDAFEFLSRDPRNGLSRERQELAFRAFNRMVHNSSSIGFSPAARELIMGWYAGDLLRGRFDGRFVPLGWQNSANERQLYKKLYAVACRTCHISHVDPARPLNNTELSFARFSDFVAHPLVQFDMCSAHRMPAAEQTLSVLWGSEGRVHYFAQVPGAFGDCGL